MESDLKEGLYNANRLKEENGQDAFESNDDNDENDDDDKPGGGGQQKASQRKGVTVEKFESEIDLLRDEIQGFKEHHGELMENFRDDIDDIKSLLHQLVSGGGAGGQGAFESPAGPQPFSNQFHKDQGKGFAEHLFHSLFLFLFPAYGFMC